MAKKLLSLIIAALIIFGAGLTVYASYEKESDSVIYSLSESKEKFASDYLPSVAGVNAEWYAIGLAGEVDLTLYEEALLNYIDNHDTSSAATRLKYALCLAAIGSTDKYIDKALDNDIGALGIMSCVFGLHLLNNGYKSELYTKEALAEKICEMQLSSGGFRVTGDKIDPDTTAMTLAALAPMKNDLHIAEVIDKALSALSQVQTDNGGFISYGVENAESSAQVIIALCALGIDPKSEELFTKDGKSVYNALKSFRKEDGGFSHLATGESDPGATAQCFLALKAIERFEANDGSIYDLKLADPDGLCQYSSENDEKSDEVSPRNTFWTSYKPIAMVITLSVLGAISLVLFLLKMRNKKNYALILAVALAAILFIALTDLSSPDDYYGNEVTKDDPIGAVTFSITCEAIRDEYGTGAILEPEMLLIEEGDTAYSVLIDAARKYSLLINNTGTEAMPYVAGIDNLSEFDYGDLSGWTYLVNGESPSVSAAQYKLKDTDTVEWRYVLEVGKFD